MTRQRGFTLIEMLCALAILSLVLGASVRILSSGTLAAGATRGASQALAVAQSHLAGLETLEKPGPLDRRGSEGAIAWHDRVFRADDPAFAPAAAAHLAAWRLESEAQGADGRSVRLSTVRLTAP
jgi:prepilin-type N-terminal cleavage/methylation domain-containing protein